MAMIKKEETIVKSSSQEKVERVTEALKKLLDKEKCSLVPYLDTQPGGILPKVQLIDMEEVEKKLEERKKKDEQTKA